jgi:hypothetical protein
MRSGARARRANRRIHLRDEAKQIAGMRAAIVKLKRELFVAKTRIRELESPKVEA